MINYNYLSENIQDALDYIIEDLPDLLENNKNSEILLRENLEPRVIELLSDNCLIEKILKRKKTTSIYLLLSEEYGEREGELKEVKITLRFDEEGNYVSHKSYGVVFERDFEFYVY